MLSDTQLGVQSVIQFILRNPGRFADATIDDRTEKTRDLAGYVDHKEELYLFTADGLKEACQGHDKRQVCFELSRQGFLVRNEGKRLTLKYAIPGLGRLRLYAVKFSLLEEADED